MAKERKVTGTDIVNIYSTNEEYILDLSDSGEGFWANKENDENSSAKWLMNRGTDGFYRFMSNTNGHFLGQLGNSNIAGIDLKKNMI